MPDIVPSPTGPLAGRKIGVLMESDYVEEEIFYYERRFAEEGADVHFLTRMWGQPSLTFTGHEHRVPFSVDRSFEDVDVASYDVIIVPSGIVSDRLRYTDDVNKLAPATAFVQRAFAEPSVLVGIICHGMWLLATVPELIRGRKVVAHNNLVGRTWWSTATSSPAAVSTSATSSHTPSSVCSPNGGGHDARPCCGGSSCLTLCTTRSWTPSPATSPNTTAVAVCSRW